MMALPTSSSSPLPFCVCCGFIRLLNRVTYSRLQRHSSPFQRFSAAHFHLSAVLALLRCFVLQHISSAATFLLSLSFSTSAMVNLNAKFQISASNHKEFYIYYLAKHSKQWTRRIHLIGTAIGVVGAAASAVRMDAFGAAVSIAVGVAICWAGDAMVEKTSPTTFKNPIWSTVSNFKMVASILTGDMNI
ncbi:hypothetical protein, conserved [Leishmania tarentolae]|uniref:Transmembrane protein n=1 Tax=Leishmania tarentolae TaxID=5689 RepID=A0A640KBY8_LEITA|nr:hypothetical protein, conserved [Leishmania tarentolae]